MKKIISSLFLTALFSTACTKHPHDQEEGSPKADIQFESPVAGAIYNSGDSILIKGRASYAAPIHGYDLIIRKAGDTTKLFFKHIHEHKAQLAINAKWKAAVSNSNLQAEVVLYLDHEGHTHSKKVGFGMR
jgi:hypothetical protein